MRLENERLAGFYSRNPEFDVRTFDFHNHRAVAALDFTGADRERELPMAASYQRLLNLDAGEATATRLMEAGFGSAHAIAATTERRFVERTAALFDGGREEARKTHRRAVSLKARARHLAAAVRDIASPYSRAMLSHNMDDAAVQYFTGIPSYQTLFGGLDHCECEHCQSMYSPAAYFLDIMRITDQYITEANPIPLDLKLETRRPDLFTMALDCRNTNEIIPYLQLVNEVLELKIGADSQTGAFQTLALAPYPFNLPYSLPLNQIRLYLGYLKATLAEVFAGLLQPAAFGTAQGGGNGQSGAPAYIVLAADSVGAVDAYAGMVVAVTAGAGSGESRAITAYDPATFKASVEKDWPPSGIPDASSKYTITDYRDVGREYLKLSLEQYGIVTTPAPGDANVRKYYGYPQSAVMFLPLAGGAGNLTFSAGAADVTGSGGSNFGSGVTVGDVIACAGEYRTVRSIQSATQLTVDVDWSASANAAGYLVAHWLDGAGQIRFTKGSPIAFGNEATHFETTLTPGDQLQCAGQVRTVVAIGPPDPVTKEIPVEVAGPWGATAGFSAYTMNPVAALDIVATFCARTGLSREQTAALLTQRLSPAEWTAGVANWFFINDTGEGLPALQILVDENDPFRSYDKIAGLSLKRLDRLNRFVRLNNVIGWTAEELNWALVAINPAPSAASPFQTTEIDAGAIESLAGIARLKAVLNLPVTALCGFWYNLKTTGRGEGVYPADLFDQIYNGPALLDGQNPYDANKPAIPFDPARPLDWKVQEGAPAPPADAVTSNATIRSRLLGALLVNDNDLTSVANYLLALLNDASGVLKLDLANLTWLYRLTKQASALQFTPDEYLRFLRLYYYTPDAQPCSNATAIAPPLTHSGPLDPGLQPPAGGLNETIVNTLLWQSAAAWVKASPFNVYDLQYILAGEQSKACQCGFTPADVANFIRDLSALSVDLRLTWGSFETEDVDSGKSLKIFKDLMKRGYINQHGIVLNVDDFSYPRLAFLFPITAASFISPDITEAESAEAFELLKAATYQGLKYLEQEPVNNAYAVSEKFDEGWPLAFLFPNDPDPASAAQKRIEVQTVLLAAQSDIKNTSKVIETACDAQEQQARAGLGHFLAATDEMLRALLWFTERVRTLTAYRGSLLTPLPAGAPPPADAYCLTAKLARATLWASRLELAAFDVDAAGRNPAAFGIADTANLTFSGLRTLSAFKTLSRAFVARPGALAAYFANSANLDAAQQLAALAEITGWDARQIRFLAERFWPFGSTLAGGGYQTVSGVERLKRCFDLGASMGVDVYFLQNLYHLSDVPLADGAGALLPAAWDVYTARARNTLDALRQKSGPDKFAEQFQSITGALDTQKRNALLGYAIWTLNREFPEIRTPSDLYQFLLIDVEMSSCATTSRIAQGIASVQLYMQRCRMNLEPYVSVADIPAVWWEWMSNYRVWEANRKIFLYPENYIEPSLRKDATPLFRKLSEKLLQSDVNNATVSAAFQEYFESLTLLAGLEPCGSYTYSRPNATTGEPTDVLTLLARTSTEPYTFYYRLVTRVSACAAAATALDWGAWIKIDLTIKAKWVTPVFAYERLFVFWIETEEVRSSQIAGSASSAQATTKATVKYSFPSGEGRWVQPQVLVTNDPIWVNPNIGYPPAQDAGVSSRFQPQWMAWNQPYVLKVSRGLVGQGLLTFAANFNVAEGSNSDLLRQARDGDSIWCAGELREIAAVVPGEQLVMQSSWSVAAKKAPYKIIPKDSERTRFEPFTGPGTVKTFQGIPVVEGVGTSFLSNISAGDRMQVGGRIYGVVTVDSNTSALLDDGMPATAAGLSYAVIPATDGNERLLVFFGAPLAISTAVDPGSRPASPDGVADAFQQSVLQFNNSAYDSLVMTSSGRNQKIPGYATLSIATWLDPDLLSETAHLLIADYTWLPISGQEPIPQPYQALVDPSLALLKVVPADSVISDNAWTNRAGVTPPALVPNAAANGLDLLYHISPATSSLLNVGNQVGWYVYNNGDEAFSFQSDESNVGKISDQAFVNPYPLPADQVRGAPDVLSCGPYTDSATRFPNTKFTVNRLTTRAVAFLNQRLFAGGVPALLTLKSQFTQELPFRRFFALPDAGPPNGVNPAHLPPDVMDFEGSYGLYFWETFFFAPFLVADRLTANQRFDEARLWLQYIFNPTEPPEPDSPRPSDRYWRFRPFRDMTLESVWAILTNCAQIERYNNNPFNPDAIARLRPTAYAKAVVLRYIDNLLKWGDSLFSQDTRESINVATQLYVTASDLLGPRPASLGKCVTPKPASFAEIKAHYPDGIPQFLIDLENTPAMRPAGCCQVVDDPGLDIHSYFCVPENDDLTRYWDQVEDRLFKIRHCMNIKGIERELALFAPPIDPRKLIQASAAGQTGGAPVTGSVQAPIPFYRFTTTMQMAQNLTAAVVGLGSSLLAALEKNDAEQLALLRNTQELALLNLTTQIKQQQIEQTVQIGQSLEISRQSAAYRQTFYNGLIASGLLPTELLNIAALTVANYLTLVASIMKTMSGLSHLIPNVGSPFAMTYGGVQVGSSLFAVGSYFEAVAGFQNFIANLSLTMAGYQRREQDWKLQAQLAAYDEQQTAAQILANNTQRLMSERELEAHYESIHQTQEVENFYKTRFTSQELYQWMIGRISAVYFQSYSLAYDMARSAQRAYQYELASSQEFVNFGYWDSLKKGLLAGEGLQLALSQMEKSYFDRNVRALEIEKTISLMQVNPAALFDLKNKGECMFELNEELFDLDFPGQYLRKIKTLSVSIPAVVGPYQNIKATLTQMNNQLVMSPDINAVKFLLGSGGDTPPASLRSNIWTNQQIAISRGVNDSGMFELSFSDPRYLPFEGTGAVSGWKLSMPLATNRLNFAAITDVVVQLKYTAFYGGDDFQKLVRENVTSYSGGILLSLAQTYSQQWYAFLQNHSDPGAQTLDFELPPGFVPSFLKNPKLTGVFTQLELKAGLSADQAQAYIDFDAAAGVNPIPLPIRSGNGGFADSFSPIPLASVTGARKITFRLNQTPSSLLVNGFLDPAALRNIGLILYIEGEINWR